MDPFPRLPPEICIMIMVNIESQTSIMDLIHASPVMCSQYIGNKKSIIRQILANIMSGRLNEDILQDALGILHFPSHSYDNHLLIRHHVVQWIAKGIPDPFSQSQPQSLDEDNTISKVHCIFSRTILFIEDYVSKATDAFPPRAYLALPPVAAGGDRLFKGCSVGIKSVSFSTLRSSEKSRFIAAFLKYEMLCKVYNPAVWNVIKGTRDADLLLAKHDKLPATELRALFCVREYVKAVYGGMFGHCQNAWLPGRPIISAPEASTAGALLPRTKNKLLYPDTVYFDAVDYFKVMNDTGNGRLADILPCLGLDLLAHLLTSFNADANYGQYLKPWLSTLNQRLSPFYRTRNPLEHFFSRYEQSVSYDSAIFFRGLPDESCRKRTSIIAQHKQLPRYMRNDRDPATLQQNQHELQLKIYRQRAWGVFDDTRLYPDTALHFPSMDNLDEQRAAGTSISPHHERARRRSQDWQDWYSGRSIETPLEKVKEEPLVGGLVGDDETRLPRFFNKNLVIRQWYLAGPD
ncbi:hypothetical protein NM208_g7598 [Fusarium decemcellulare]|uniref:Uncharacterized protein n=1 Tax=Fusarium decemcellulare TaxID=57161 RepID=A0ACC1S8G5_9HYPO|nr:hypothetical protein NM208_g7598 [Fusarium decemcellulare]